MKPESPYPREQMALLHAEVDRQRDTLARRHGNMHTRAAILVAASGILGTFQSESWPSGWQLLGVGLALLAAGHGLWVMRPIKGKDPVAANHVEKMLSSHPYSTEYRIVMDNIGGLRDDMDALSRAASVVSRGYVLLVSSWIATAAINGLMSRS